MTLSRIVSLKLQKGLSRIITLTIGLSRIITITITKRLSRIIISLTLVCLSDQRRIQGGNPVMAPIEVGNGVWPPGEERIMIVL